MPPINQTPALRKARSLTCSTVVGHLQGPIDAHLACRLPSTPSAPSLLQSWDRSNLAPSTSLQVLPAPVQPLLAGQSFFPPPQQHPAAC